MRALRVETLLRDVIPPNPENEEPAPDTDPEPDKTTPES
jgi:hypothetical protein